MQFARPKERDLQTFPTTSRHFGMDWLRIGAFAILIFYHTGLHFGPHPWVVRAKETYDWLIFPLSAIAPWRLMVLFAVSGFASAAMLGKIGSLQRFFSERSWRLLLPLFFGILFLIPPQSWARVRIELGYTESLLTFWTNDYLRFGQLGGHTLPHWEHLWFLGYLWAYTAILVVLLALVRRWPEHVSAVVAFFGKGYRLLVLPALVMMGARLGFTYLQIGNTGMFDDWIGDAHYLPAFFFGFLLAVEPKLWEVVRRIWKGTAIVAFACLFVILFELLQFHSVDDMPRPALVAEYGADSLMGWSAMLALVALADRYFNADHPWRETLARAVFPAYLVHQTVIVLLGYWLLQFTIPGGLAFLVIVAGVSGAAVLAWQLASRSRWIGPLLGVPHGKASVKSQVSTI